MKYAINFIFWNTNACIANLDRNDSTLEFNGYRNIATFSKFNRIADTRLLMT